MFKSWFSNSTYLKNNFHCLIACLLVWRWQSYDFIYPVYSNFLLQFISQISRSWVLEMLHFRMTTQPRSYFRTASPWGNVFSGLYLGESHSCEYFFSQASLPGHNRWWGKFEWWGWLPGHDFWTWPQNIYLLWSTLQWLLLI